MRDDLGALLDAVKDESSFLVFARELVADRERAVAAERARPSSPYGSDAGGWENVRIETYLDAAIGWAEDTEFGKTQGLSPSNPWKQFATFLLVGSIYE